MLTRRCVLRLAAGCAVLPAFAARAAEETPTGRFDIAALKPGYLKRIAAMRAAGKLPIFDIESSYDPGKIDLEDFVREMDRTGVAVMAFSPDLPGRDLKKKGITWSHHVFELIRLHPDHFYPTGNGGVHPAWTKNPARFLDDNERYIIAHGYPLMGEFEFRHYMSPRQAERNETHRDFALPIDGPEGERLFAFAEKTGIPFQIHYEIEDQLLPPLEAMLTRHPKAKVIWCHLAQIRYKERSTLYSPDYLRGLFARFPNLYIDTAFGGPYGIYGPSGQRHARVWTDGGDIRPEWTALIAEQPYRFLAALDIGGDRMDRLGDWVRNLRYFLDRLPEPSRQIVAYRSAWKLLFGEEIAV